MLKTKRKPCITVHTSDWHTGHEDFDSLFLSVMDEKQGFITKVEEIAEACKVEGIQFGGLVVEGDLYHTKVSNNSKEQRFIMDTVSILVDIVIKRYGAKIIFIRGTFGHDFNQIENFKGFELMYPGQFEIFDTVGETTIGDGYTVLCIPEEYMPESEQEKFYAPYFSKTYDMTCMHGFFDFNCFARNAIEKHFDGMPIFKHKDMLERSRLTIAGHDHRHQVVDGRLAYNGPLIRMTFGEDDPKGFIYTYMDDEEVEIHFEENLLSPTFKTLSLQDLVKDGNYEFDNVATIVEKEFEKVDNLRIRISSGIMSENPELILLLRERFFRESKLKFEGQSVLRDGRVISKEEMAGISIREDGSDTVSEITNNEFEFILDDRKSQTEKIKEFILKKHPELTIKLDDAKINEIISDQS